ncbi:MAG TPA: S8 family serine peptidase, partial [Solirubrobacterales bacterium]|nr:S8 family serine peptidase [Solirubrobacterales bacterium]
MGPSPGSPVAGADFLAGSFGFPSNPGENGSRIPGHYIVVFKDSVKGPSSVAGAQVKRQHAKLGFVYRSAIKGYSASDLSRSDVEALRRDPHVKYVTPDRRVEVASQETPTGIERTGGLSNENLAVDEGDDMRVDADVAVLDTGIDYEHPDLNVVHRTDCVSEGCFDGIGRDAYGHGTHVAGTIGALDNGQGVVGVAPGVRLWAVKVLNAKGSGSEARIVAGVEWVTEHASQIEVANMSLGCKCSLPALDEAIEASAEAGVVYALAAGNSAIDVAEFSPAGNPDAITVSALADYDGEAGGKGSPTCGNRGADDKLASFSNYGEGVNVAAPGVCILSTFPTGNEFALEPYETSEGYGVISGTSMAAPHVAGAAALLAGEKKPEDLKDVEAIRQTIEEKGSQEWEDTSEDGNQEPLLDVSDGASFDPSDQAVTTGPTTVLSGTEVTLTGAVNPDGQKAEYYFEYGTTSEYGLKIPAAGSSLGSGEEYVGVEETVDGIEEEAVYHYRLVAIREEEGKEATFFGNDRTFLTSLPVVSDQAATEISANGATLNATVDLVAGNGVYRVDYGPTASYGYSLPREEEEGVVADAGATTISQKLFGLDGGTTYHFRVVADNLAGEASGEDRTFSTPPSEWVRQPLPNVHQEEEEQASNVIGTQLIDVSCVSRAYCVAVGTTRLDSVRYPEALLWNGESWVKSDLPVPEGIDRNEVEVRSVSCVNEHFCMALAYDRFNESGGRQVFADRWDGEEWTALEMPIAAETEAAASEGRRLSCSAVNLCMAVGRAQGPSNKPALELINLWDGEDWSLAPPLPLSEDGYGVAPRSVSCVAGGSCMVVVGYEEDDWMATWDGKSWRTEQMPAVPETEWDRYTAISCTSTAACTVIGWGEPENTIIPFLVAARWGGEGWELQELPQPPPSGSLFKEPAAVSCPTPTSCTFVTFYFYLGQGTEGTLAEHWDGSQWSIQSTANPRLNGSLLEAASCSVPSFCVAVGSGRKNPEESYHLIEQFTDGGLYLTGEGGSEPPPRFEASAYPKPFGSEAAAFTAAIPGAGISCAKTTVHGEIAEASTQLGLEPEYGECTFTIGESESPGEVE